MVFTGFRMVFTGKCMVFTGRCGRNEWCLLVLELCLLGVMVGTSGGFWFWSGVYLQRSGAYWYNAMTRALGCSLRGELHLRAESA